MATETKFTRGPYALCPEHGGIFSRDPGDHFGIQICEQPTEGLEGHTAWEHNKHLIAAAPDLYAALSGALGNFRAREAHCKGEDARIAAEYARMIEAVQAKARGEAV